MEETLKKLDAQTVNAARAGIVSRVTRVDDPRVATHCFHCGEPCRDLQFTREEKAFCCQGCLLVHDLLTEHGLEHFYALDRTPGVRIRGRLEQTQWNFLDEPSVQQRLLDFTDDNLSRVTFHVPAIHCVACVWLLENLFRLNPGIGRTQVNFPKREVVIRFASKQIKLSELVTLLASIGYEPSLTLGTLDKRTGNSGRQRQWLQVGIAGFAFGNIMLFSLPQYFGLDGFSGPAFKAVFGWLSLALALPVVVFSAADYWKSALLSIRQRVLTLDVPIALGLAAIYGQSASEIISRSGEGYCDSLTGLIFFLLCGRVFQKKTQDRLVFDRDYKSFFPLSALRIHHAATGVEERVALSELRVGDHLLIRNGEIIPADARLISKLASIDYSFVTGESEPVAKREGDYLYAGGQEIGGAIEVEMVKAVSQGYLTSLWNHDAFQKDREDNLNTLTNRYSRRFTRLVIGMAIAAAVFWMLQGNTARGLKAFTSVLIVACPCALALAAPFTLGTAQRWLARVNVFLKNAGVLERIARVDTIVFDKTGTLTAASVNAVGFHPAPRSMLHLSADEKRCIYSLARQSTHPLSTWISESFGGAQIAEPVESFREIPGCGIEGRVCDRAVWLGSEAWLESRGLNCSGKESASFSGQKTPHSAAGTCVHIAIDGNYRGTFELSHNLRPETDHLLTALRQHYDLALLSGDNERERQRFTALFGEKARLHFNQTPLEKLGFIRGLQESGRTVMMVGDGLNDAGALRQSDVGVAVVEKIGAFSPASDVILDASQVQQLFEFLTFARRATRIVRLSFAISAAYNLVGVSIAAAGLLSPIVCAVLMPLSSASVVLFACALTTWTARSLVRPALPVSRLAHQRRVPGISHENSTRTAEIGGANALQPRTTSEAIP